MLYRPSLFGIAASLLLSAAIAQTPAAESDQEPPSVGDETPETESATEPGFQARAKMSSQRLGEIISQLDADAVEDGNSWRFSFHERPIFLVYDDNADRMRVMSPVISSDALTDELMFRMLQANYDAVLDPRYAIAQGIVWSAFIHPLSALSEEQFASAVVQVFIAAQTFGSSFTSGALIFGGGDSQEEHQRLLEELNKIIQPTT